MMLISDLMESKLSSSNYKHQSGSLKRKIQAERLRKESVGREKNYNQIFQVKF